MAIRISQRSKGMDMDIMDNIVRIAITAPIIGIVAMTFAVVFGNIALAAWIFLVIVVCIAIAVIAMLFS
jgi:hypothetical protein